MADEIEVGELVIRLIADAKQLEKSLEKATGRTSKFGKDTEKSLDKTDKAAKSLGLSLTRIAGRVAGLAIAYASVNAVLNAFRNQIDVSSQLDQLSQTTGVSIQRLSELREVTVQLGIDFNTLGQSLSQFGPRIQKAIANPASEAARAARAIGIELRDAEGGIKSFEQVLTEAAERFPEYQDGANKAAIASALFGSAAGPKLIPLLNQGVSGLRRLKEAVGGSFTREDAQRAREYRETIGRLQLAFETFFREVTRAAGPTLIKILDQLSEFLIRSNDLRDALDSESQEVRTAAGAYELAKQKLKELRQERSRLVGTFTHQIFGAGEEEVKRVTAEIERQEKIVRAIKQALDDLVNAHTPPPDTRPELPGISGGSDREGMKQAQFELSQLMDRLTGTRDIFDEINLSWQGHSDVVQEALAKVNEAYKTSGDRRRALAQVHTAMARVEQQEMLDTASKAAQTITALWPKQKGAAIAAATINTAVGITNALRQGPTPWAIAQAALIGAMGAAQIAQIRSMSEDGSGAGSAPAAISQAPAEAPQEAPGRSLHIEGIDPAAIFSGRQLEELIHGINTEVQNGVTLISTRNLPL